MPIQHSYGAMPPLAGGHPTAWKWAEKRAEYVNLTPTRFDAFAAGAPAVRDQDLPYPTGSCVPHAAITAIQAQLLAAGIPEQMLSAVFAWWFARATEGSAGQNNGTFPHDVLTELRNRGTCYDLLYPNDAACISTAPSSGAQALAQHFAGIEFFQCENIDALRESMAALNSGGMVTFGVRPSYESPTNGRVVYNPAESILGWHENLIRGYDERDDIWRNSWGEGFGDRGEIRMTRADSAQVAVEFWTLQVTPEMIARIKDFLGLTPKPEPTPTPTPEPTPTPVPVPVEPAIRTALAPLFGWFRDARFGWDASALAALDGWQAWIDANVELIP